MIELIVGYQESFSIICAEVADQYGSWTPYDAVWIYGGFIFNFSDGRARITLLRRHVRQELIQLAMQHGSFNMVMRTS